MHRRQKNFLCRIQLFLRTCQQYNKIAVSSRKGYKKDGLNICIFQTIFHELNSVSYVQLFPLILSGYYLSKLFNPFLCITHRIFYEASNF